MEKEEKEKKDDLLTCVASPQVKTIRTATFQWVWYPKLQIC